MRLWIFTQHLHTENCQGIVKGTKRSRPYVQPFIAASEERNESLLSFRPSEDATQVQYRAARLARLYERSEFLKYRGARPAEPLLSRGRCRSFFLGFMSRRAECFFASLQAARFARRHPRNIKHDFPIVSAAIRTCTVRYSKRAAFTADGTQGAQRMMAAAFSCL